MTLGLGNQPSVNITKLENLNKGSMNFRCHYWGLVHVEVSFGKRCDKVYIIYTMTAFTTKVNGGQSK
ncbi:hypothetical protein SDC9_107316 [bioreactor metagenome]|uniref:Uncharacterized protein n=1 Tax=bioreactor metagenome TaxID=1076179 RepID=A0A645B4V6_9ZZZZ